MPRIHTYRGRCPVFRPFDGVDARLLPTYGGCSPCGVAPQVRLRPCVCCYGWPSHLRKPSIYLIARGQSTQETNNKKEIQRGGGTSNKTQQRTRTHHSLPSPLAVLPLPPRPVPWPPVQIAAAPFEKPLKTALFKTKPPVIAAQGQGERGRRVLGISRAAGCRARSRGQPPRAWPGPRADHSARSWSLGHDRPAFARSQCRPPGQVSH